MHASAPTRDREAPAVGTERNGRDRSADGQHLGGAITPVNIPHVNQAVVTCRGDLIAIGTPRGSIQTAGVIKARDAKTRGGVPESSGPMPSRREPYG